MLTVNDLTATRQMLLQVAAGLYRSGRLSQSESVSLDEAVGLILAEPVVAGQDVPAFDRAQVDGLAVRAADTFGCSESLPAMLRYCGEVLMGQTPGLSLEPGACQGVPTGGAIPPGADAMVMIETVDDFGDGYRYINSPVSPGQNLIFRGDDLRAGQQLLPAGLRLQPHHLAAVAAVGLDRVTVRQSLHVALISTGDELVAPGRPLRPGQVYDANLPMLTAMVRQSGACPRSFGIVADTPDALKETLQQAKACCSLIVLSGGSSVGARDHVSEAVTASGKPGILQHGIAVKPGKPTLIGQIGDCLVLGLPGHPAAAWFMALLLLKPLLACLQGKPEPETCVQTARLSRQIPSNHGREELVPVRLSSSADAGNLPVATPVFGKSGLIALLRDCQGYIRIPRDCEGLDAGSPVAVTLLEQQSLREGDKRCHT